VDKAAVDDDGDGDVGRFGRRLLELRWSAIEQQAREDSYHAVLNSQLQVKLSWDPLYRFLLYSILLSRFLKKNLSCNWRSASWN
jgi:hypothetical protein